MWCPPLILRISAGFDPSKLKDNTIYKTSVNGKKRKIKTVSHQVIPYTYYNGKLYYRVLDEPDRLYAYDTAKKTTKKLKLKNFFGESGYGKYITYNNYSDQQYIYDVTTGKSKKLPGASTVVYGKSVYYCTDFSNGVAVKKCDLSGKHSKTIKKITGDVNVEVDYLGRTMAHFRNQPKGQYWKLIYKTKKLTQTHF